MQPVVKLIQEALTAAFKLYVSSPDKIDQHNYSIRNSQEIKACIVTVTNDLFEYAGYQNQLYFLVQYTCVIKYKG